MSDKKQEAIGFLIGRVFFLIIAILFVLYGLFIKQPCDIDAVFLSCRLTGSLMDYIGSGMFLSGLLVMSGVIRGFKYLYNPPNSTPLNYLFGAFMIAGPIIFWNL